jgi:hypothetical protein
MTTQERIEAARKLCPPPYRDFQFHKMPRAQKFRRLAEKLQTIVGTFDHWGTATLNGKPCLVLQPYGLSAHTHILVEQLARDEGMTCKCYAASEHYPGKTFSLVFTE